LIETVQLGIKMEKFGNLYCKVHLCGNSERKFYGVGIVI